MSPASRRLAEILLVVLPTVLVGGVSLLRALLWDPAAAQEPPPRVEEEVRVEEVLLDVLVTDPRGNVILGLDEDDFRVTEDGEPVELTDAVFYSNRRFLDAAGPALPAGLDVSRVPVDRSFVLLFQDMHRVLPRLMAQQLEAGNRARRWAATLSSNDWVAVLSYDDELLVHTDFTTDLETLERAIDEAAASRGASGDWPSRRPDTDGPSLLAHLPQGADLARQTRRIQKAFEVLGDALEPIAGRKNLVFLGIGFGDLDDFGFYTPDPRYYPPMVRSLNDGNVAVYGIDLVPTAFSGRLLQSGYGSALSSLAADTGGEYYFSFVNFLTPLEQIDQDNNGYYLLSYRSEHPRDATGYQEVEVETVNPRFEVRARRGYTIGD